VELIQRNNESLFSAPLNLYCMRLPRYCLDANADTWGLRMNAPNQLLTLSIISIAMGVLVWYFV
jgi:hypothetical protein